MPETNSWFTEFFTPDAKFSIRIKERLADTKSAFQKIDCYDSFEFGRFFALDGYLMLTERDEFIYHEMIVHVPMAVLGQARDVLVVGGGDGGTARELCRYACVRRVDVAEVDGAVVELCKKYLPFTAKSFGDPRVRLHIGDGAAYVQNCRDSYDLVIVDSTDPVGVGEGLFSEGFYQNCARILRPGGVLVNQHESPYYAGDAREMRRAHQKLRAAFPVARVYQAHIPTYASGHWLFGFASRGIDPVAGLDAERWERLGLETKYYNTALHRGCFDLPTYVIELLNGTEKAEK